MPDGKRRGARSNRRAALEWARRCASLGYPPIGTGPRRSPLACADILIPKNGVAGLRRRQERCLERLAAIQARLNIVMAFLVTAYIIMASVVVACVVMASNAGSSCRPIIVMAYTVMACTVMSYIVMAYTVMACTVMSYIVMACIMMASNTGSSS